MSKKSNKEKEKTGLEEEQDQENDEWVDNELDVEKMDGGVRLLPMRNIRR